MSELNKIYEITQSLSSPESVGSELRELSALISEHLASKYISPINAVIASHRQYCTTHPVRETNLLAALKPFTSKPDGIDRLIEMFNTARLINDIVYGGLAAIRSTSDGCVRTAAITDSAVHPDGIYEIDEGCISAGTSCTDGTEGLCPAALVILLLLLAIG